jgi:general secretion pathway protein G
MSIFSKSKNGFTIVELLIVIVVISILAAITILAYNGVQQKAIVASLSSDLDSASKRLKLDQVDLGGYPATTALANNGAGLQASPNDTYQYSVNNSVSPQTFCLTATNGTNSYFISQDGIPQIGGCPGHSVGGVFILTNLITNPSFETGVAGWVTYVGINAPTQVTTTPWSGSARLSATGNNTASNPRARYTLPVTVGDTISVSVRIRSDGQVPTSMLFVIKTRQAGVENGTPIAQVPAWAPDANGWMQGTATLTIPANVDDIIILPGVNTSSNFVGTLGVDGVIATKTTTPANYADGSSPGWVWNGAVNASTSTGPAL